MNRQHVFTGLVILVIAFNLSVFVVVSSYIDNFADTKVKLTTQDLRNNISDRIAVYTNVLYAAAGLFSASTDVTRSEWHTFLEKTDVFARYPGADAIVYAPAIQPENLTAFTASVRQLGVESFAVYPNNPSELIVPILYVESVNPNAQKAIGFNMFTESNRKAAIEYAMDNNSIAVTNRIVPATDASVGKQSAGFIIFYPVYKNGMPISTVEERRANIQGFVTVGIRPERFMEGLSLNIVPGIKFQLFDHSAEGELSEQSLLYNSGTEVMAQPGYVSRYGSVDILPWPNMDWHIRYIAERNLPLLQLVKTVQYLVAAAVMSFSVLFLVLIYFVFRKSHRLRYLLAQYKTKLKTEDALVDEMPNAILVTDDRGVVQVYNAAARELLRYPASSVVGTMSIIKMLVPGSVADFDELITQSLIDGKDTQQLEFRSGDGKHVSVVTSIHPVFDGSQDLVGYEFTF